MNLETFFKDEPKAKAAFFSWWHEQFPRLEYYPDVYKLPGFILYPILIAWLDSEGIYIDRDTEKNGHRIWDYREGEPDKAYGIENIHGEKYEYSLREAVQAGMKIYLNISID